MANVTGLITVNSKQVLEVDADPSAAAGTAAPMGSLAMYDSGSVGELYIKSGAADTAWSKVEVPDQSDWNLDGNTVGAEKFIGTLDNFEFPIRVNNVEEARVISGGLLLGLNTSIGGRLQLSSAANGDDIIKEALNIGASEIIHVTRMARLTTTGAASATFDFAIPSDYNCKIEVNVVAKQTGGSTGSVSDGASYQRTTHARNIGGTVALLGGVQSDFTYEVANALNFTLTANAANVRGTVTGATNRNLSWGLHSSLLMIAG
jgi:hypothetical protein